ncbi:MAG: tyrosine-type recombinase/integrase [Xanthobacteraceae bacterium]|nr:tyrosine-type recombinase/integrase [Xanthobacteraceae bacterium]
MPTRLTERIVSDLAVPERGNRITYDAPNQRGGDWTAGFGVRVTASGHRSFILNYRTKTGRERRFTIGAPPAWTLEAARLEAAKLKARVDLGEDPMGAVHAGREAPTVADLCDRFEKEWLPKKRDKTQDDYSRYIKNDIKPELGKLKVAEVSYSDVEALHRKITKRAPTSANRVIAALSKMFALSIRWHMRADNPARGIERNEETKRKRYLSGEEIARLSEALSNAEDKQAANIVRLLLLTGARSGEVMGARWDQFNFESGVWTKPASTTKSKADHVVPLSGPARLLLAELAKEAAEGAEYVFPGRGSPHRVDIKKAWPKFCKAAKLTNARPHDLRHTYASILASAGQSLPVIGALLGHSQPITTARYAHLFDDPLRKATERVGAILKQLPKRATSG